MESNISYDSKLENTKLVRSYPIEDSLKKDINMQIIEWWARDEDNSEINSDSDDSTDDKISSVYTIRCFGVTEQGIATTCKITGFQPFYYIKVGSDFNSIKLHHFLNFVSSSWTLNKFKCPLAKDSRGKHRSCIVEKKDLFGFRNGKIFKFVKLVFTNYTALMKSKYIFKKLLRIPNVTISPTKFKLYESNFEGFMRYCHIKDILMAGWIKLPYGKYKVTSDSASTQLEVSIDRKEVVSLKEIKKMANFLQASWDIEVYSHDGTFPDPNKQINGKRPNEIFQIATTFKYFHDKETFCKHLLTLKKCAPINEPNVIVQECKDEKELIKSWVDLIHKMDPDIMYTYNGDTFDCSYIIERAKLYGYVSEDKKSGYLLNKLSRLTEVPCVVKKETFSSSAYGDSEFTRMYIPGRLNYDLLIHYKRGMKKYPSYKLDFIANEILKEGKNDVDAKDIFNYYKQGKPELINKIGRYCIQDTELLQKLVDKQLILITIIQLANVTYVPIGFLTTRGQTIKVYSQLLRKARQLDFLVPHTNFNEDAYPITIKIKETDVFTTDDINNYIDILLGVHNGKRVSISAKIKEIIDENTIIVNSDTEITKEYYNRTISYNGRSFTASRLFSSEDAVDSSFTGATVLDPLPGMYKSDNIAVLDFASLYPTIMISRNLCYSTFVFDDKYKGLPNVMYEPIEWDDKVEFKLKHTCEGVGKSGKSKGLVCGKQAYFEVEGKYFCRIHDPHKKSRGPDEKYQKRDVSYKYTIVQPHINENGERVNIGVLPSLLEELYSERKKVKKEMAKALQNDDKTLADILDSTQLAIKVSLNSTYGFLGRCQGNLILKELGSIVTYVGRKLIEESKEYAEGQFLDYVKRNKLVTQKLQVKSTNLSTDEKQKILNKFRI